MKQKYISPQINVFKSHTQMILAGSTEHIDGTTGDGGNIARSKSSFVDDYDYDTRDSIPFYRRYYK